MSRADAVLALIVAGLTAYILLAGADFGAGFWELVTGRSERGEQIRETIHQSVGPVWEANHVWLIFVLVLLWTGFPRAFGSIASTLFIPLFLAVVGIVLRGAAFAFQPHTRTGRPAAALSAVFGASSVLAPFMLGAALGGLASGRVPVGNAAGNPATSWLNPTSMLVGALAVASGLYLAAVYLAADSERRGDSDLVEAFRRRALIAGTAAGALAIGGLEVVRRDAPLLWDGLTSGGAPAVVASAIFGIVTLTLVAARRYALARVGAAMAVAAIVLGWALAQRPFILPGELSISAAAAHPATLTALLVGAAIGAVILIPSLIWLFRLTLVGTFDRPPASG